MSDVDPRAWAGEIAQALTFEGERVPFQRVLRIHQHGLDALRARGLTWQSLVQLLLRAGVQRPNGHPYSADQLRVCAERLKRDDPGTEASAAAIPSGAGARSVSARPDRRRTASTRIAPSDGPAPRRARRETAHSVPPIPTRAAPAFEDKDVSVDEIAAARARLNQTR